MGVPVRTGQVAVSATAAPLTQDEFPVETVILKAAPENEAEVYFGRGGVTPSNGYPLSAGEEFQVRPALGNLSRTPKPKDLYVVGSSGDTLAWIATPR